MVSASCLEGVMYSYKSKILFEKTVEYEIVFAKNPKQFSTLKKLKEQALSPN